ncbi:MAG: hypothetical protein ACKPKO_15650 [Candidatus Fonsibacter sp.]
MKKVALYTTEKTWSKSGDDIIRYKDKLLQFRRPRLNRPPRPKRQQTDDFLMLKKVVSLVRNCIIFFESLSPQKHIKQAVGEIYADDNLYN